MLKPVHCAFRKKLGFRHALLINQEVTANGDGSYAGKRLGRTTSAIWGARQAKYIAEQTWKFLWAHGHQYARAAYPERARPALPPLDMHT